MHVLVASDSHRCTVLVPGSATAWELKEKVQKQTKVKAELMTLSLHGEVLCDELTLSEQQVADRDRIELTVGALPPPAPGGGSGEGAAALNAALSALDAVALQLDTLQRQVGAEEDVHQGEPS